MSTGLPPRHFPETTHRSKPPKSRSPGLLRLIRSDDARRDRQHEMNCVLRTIDGSRSRYYLRNGFIDVNTRLIRMSRNCRNSKDDRGDISEHENDHNRSGQRLGDCDDRQNRLTSKYSHAHPRYRGRSSKPKDQKHCPSYWIRTARPKSGSDPQLKPLCGRWRRTQWQRHSATKSNYGSRFSLSQSWPNGLPLSRRAFSAAGSSGGLGGCSLGPALTQRCCWAPPPTRLQFLG